MEYLFIYSLQIAEYIKYIAGIAIIIVIFYLGVMFITARAIIEKEQDVSLFILDEEKEEKIKKINKEYAPAMKHARKMAIIYTFLSLILLFLPTKQTLILMSGIYYSKVVLQQTIINEKVQKINKIINLQLDNIIEKMEK